MELKVALAVLPLLVLVSCSMQLQMTVLQGRDMEATVVKPRPAELPSGPLGPEESP